MWVHHSLALTDDGTVVAWGRNDYGQSTVPAGLKAVQIAGGVYHSLALTDDGTVVAWGLELWSIHGSCWSESRANSMGNTILLPLQMMEVL